MKRKYKAYLKLNLLSLFCLGVSFISITLAWFAYSGLSTVSTEVDVKAWNIEFMKDSQAVTNEIVIDVDDIYPGMNPIIEKISIHNLGDSDAMLSYQVVSARVLNEDLAEQEKGYLVDLLSHDLPFHINISLEDRYVEAKNGVSDFSVSVSWPLDSLNDERDSKWGNEAYKFQQEEQQKHEQDPNYIPRKSLKIVISVKAEQFIDAPETPDINYNVGDLILYDVVNNQRCETISSTCLKTYVMDANNTLANNSVTLLPDLYQTYSTGPYENYDALLNSSVSTWNVSSRALTLEDLLKVIATDNQNSFLKRDGLSDVIVGNLDFKDRITTVIDKSKSYNGRFSFLNERFPYLSSNKCYWVKTEYDTNKAYAFQRQDDTNTMIYGNDKSTSCSVVPVIVVDKVNLSE